MISLLPILVLPILAPPPGAVRLLADTPALARAEGHLVTLDGVIERNPASGRAGGSTRANLFRLRFSNSEGKEQLHELFLDEVGFRVADHVGQKARLHGKLVELKDKDGARLELWPAWLQPLSGPLVLGVDGIFARCDWQPEEARRRGERQYVFRSAEQLADALRVSGTTAGRTATDLLARRLGVPVIDWEKHMLICVSVGLQTSVEGLAVTRVRKEGDTLRVSYRLVPAPGGTFGIGYPAQTVLVERSTAEVRFERETPPRGPAR